MSSKNRVWTEKYRPTSLCEVQYQDHVVSVLSRIISDRNTVNKLPHFLFSGPAGTGKTSTAHALCHDLYGKYKSEHTLELNASDERGIAVIRSRVKDFAVCKVTSKPYDKFLVPNFKIIILDEVDALTTDAQSALRRVMEDYSANTRFILCCNYASKLIDPILSRCSNFVFQSLPEDYLKDHLKMLAKKEGFEISDQNLAIILKFCEGDCRRGVSILQIYSILGDGFDFAEICGFLPENYAKNIFAKIRGAPGNIVKSMVEESLKNGYSVTQIIRSLCEEAIESNLSDAIKCHLLMKLSALAAQAEKGASEALVMYHLYFLISTLPK